VEPRLGILAHCSGIFMFPLIYAASDEKSVDQWCHNVAHIYSQVFKSGRDSDAVTDRPSSSDHRCQTVL